MKWLVGFPSMLLLVSTLGRGLQALQIGPTTFVVCKRYVMQASMWTVERPSSVAILLPLVFRLDRSIATSSILTSRSSSISSRRVFSLISFPSTVSTHPFPSNTRKAARFDRETHPVLFFRPTGLFPRWKVLPRVHSFRIACRLDAPRLCAPGL